MLNKYMERLNILADDHRKVPITQFEGDFGIPATFDDLIWNYIDPNSGRRTRIQSGLHGRRGKGSSGSRPEDALPQPYADLVKVWILKTLPVRISMSERQNRISIARKLLSVMDGHLYEQTESSILGLDLGGRGYSRLRPFLTFCANEGLMRKVDVSSADNRDRSGHAVFDNVQDKIPDIRSILALGDIFTQVFESVNLDGDVLLGGNVNFDDAFVATFALLSLASPNRGSAEIPLLPKQKLNFYSEGGGDLVYYLNWIGSKGFNDYNNHMLAALADPITKAVNFFFKACEPARVLCRFYEKPNQSLGKLLGSYEVKSEFKKNLNFAAAPNLFTVGYALGLYTCDECIYVLKAGADIESVGRLQRSMLFESKPIYSLTPDDKVSGSKTFSSKVASLGKLFGYVSMPKDIPSQPVWTVDELQIWWLSFFKKVLIPEFPLSFSSGESRIKIKDAMFCILGAKLHSQGIKPGSGGLQFQRSKYAVVRLSTLGALATRKLTGFVAGVSIFEKYGFSTELCVRPHALRHMANTIADVSEIPVEIITAWSGRSSSEQTHTYIHTTHAEKADRVSSIINPIGVGVKDIRTVSQLQLMKTTNFPATLTSTGICTQSLNVTPCDYLNDFVSQCFMCPESCYVAGDERALKLLQTDFLFQASRLDAVRSDIRLRSSSAMQRWYVIHARNLHILSELIRLMNEHLPGTIIRYSNRDSEFVLTDLDTSKCRKISASLPDFLDELNRHLRSGLPSSKSSSSPQLIELLSSFGL